MDDTAPSGIGTMLMLGDGTVIAQQFACAKNWYKLTPDSSGSYVHGTWTTLTPMSLERRYFASQILQDGRLWVLGGEYSGPSGTQNWTETGEIYNPQTDTWSAIPDHPDGTYGDVSTAMLPDGRILSGSRNTNATYIYNPDTNSWSNGPTKLNNDKSSEESWVKLADDSILSYNINGSPQSAQRMDPATMTWVASGMCPVQLHTNPGHELGPGLRLTDGRVLFLGALSNNALYNPATNSWAVAATTPGGIGANDAPAAVLTNGHVLYAAGDTSTSFNPPTSIFDYDPGADSISAISLAGGPSLATVKPFNTRMLMLPSGQVLFTSGNSQQLYVFNSDGGPSGSWRPSISNVTSAGTNTYTLTGTQLNGLNEGASYGDDAEMSSNYPIIRTTTNTGVVSFARSFNWSSTGVATGSTLVTTNYSLTLGAGPGSRLISAVANGISSGNVLVVQGTTGNDTITIDESGGTTTATVNAAAINWSTGSFSKIFVIGGNGNDTININGTASTSPVVVNGGNDNDNVHVGGGDYDTNINAPVTVNGDAGTDTIYIDDTTDGQGSDAYTLSSTQFDKPGIGFPLNYTSTDEALIINGSPFASTYDINSLSIPLTINAGAQGDTITVGGTAGDIDSNVNDNVIIHGNGGVDTVDFNDVNDDASVDDSYTLTSLGFDKSSTTEVYGYDTVENVILTAGLADNVISVLSFSGISTDLQSLAVHGNSGNDTVNLGSGDLENDLAFSAVTVTGDAGTDALVLDDNSDAEGDDDYTITFNSFDKNTAGLNLVTYTTLEDVTLDASNFNNSINVESTTTTVLTHINAGGGNDDVHISGTAGTLFNIGGDVIVHGEAGADDSLFINDANFAGTANFTVTPTNVVLPFNSADANYATVESLEIDAGGGANIFNVNDTASNVPLIVNAGAGNDTMNVNGLTSSLVTFNGQTGTNDGMNITGTPAAPASYNPSATTPGSGNLGFSGQGIDFTGVDGAFPSITVSTLATLSCNPQGSADVIDVDSLAPTYNVITGTSGGVAITRLNYTDIGAFTLNTGAHDAASPDDVVTIHLNGLQAAAASTFRFLGGTGAGNDDTLNIESGPFTFANDASVDTSNLTVNASHAGGPATVVTFAATQHLAALNMSDDALARMSANGNRVLVTRAVSVAGTSHIDLNDNDMILDYPAASQLAAVQALINVARNGGAWNGARGLTSTSAATNAQHNTTLGAMEATEFKAIYGGAATFDGQVIDNTAVLVKYTYYGDADFNGHVNFDDYVRTDNGFNNHLSHWVNGDYDGNGQVNFDDYVLIDLAFNTQGAVLGHSTGGAGRSGTGRA